MTTSRGRSIVSFRKCRRANCAVDHCILRKGVRILKIVATKTFGGTCGGTLARERRRPQFPSETQRVSFSHCVRC